MSSSKVKQEQYVIHRHSRGEQIHWDLMLKTGPALRTYRLDVPPEELSRTGVRVEQIFDHPLKFLTYEGPVQNGTGSVKLADSGTYKILDEQQDTLEVEFYGQVLAGRYKFTVTCAT